MARKCPECRVPMVPVDSTGRPDPEGGYLACPKALEEFADLDAGMARRPFHRRPTIYETFAHAKERREAAEAAQPALFAEDVGRGRRSRMED